MKDAVGENGRERKRREEKGREEFSGSRHATLGFFPSALGCGSGVGSLLMLAPYSSGHWVRQKHPPLSLDPRTGKDGGILGSSVRVVPLCLSQL